jgi:hypothetical protein
MLETDVRALVAGAIRGMNHSPVLEICSASLDQKFGIWTVNVNNSSPGGRREFSIAFKERGRSYTELVNVFRHELRQQLWSCPLCDRRGYIDRQSDLTFFVECPECGRFLISHPAVLEFRGAWDRGDEGHIRHFSGLREYVRTHQNDSDMPTITAQWEGLLAR